MSDTQGQPGQPSPEELRAYVEQMRDADPGELIAQAFTMLGTGAEVKLGRSDARPLIDAMAALAEATEGKIPAQLTSGMRNGVSQLQMAQVEAERQSAGGAEPQPTGDAAADRPAGEASDAAASPPPAAGEQQAEDQRMTDRLWIPGRGQPPPPRNGG